MKTYLSKLLWAIWLLLLGSMYAQAIESPTFAYDEHVNARIAYGVGANLSLVYDRKPVFCENNMPGHLICPHALFAKFSEFLAAEGIANPVPSTLARVIPGEGPFTTLGAPGSADVFVTDASAIQGMTPAQISQRLGIPASDTFTTIQFPTPAQGLASPVFRSNPGFIGGGVTSGGAPEFVIPNGPIPAGATTTILGPH
jgi:hypothetical protein